MADFQEENYDQAVGPKVQIKREGGGPSDQYRTRRGPRDLERSRRVGITEVKCASCGADCGHTPIHHAGDCKAIRAGGFERVRLTRPLRLVYPSSE